MGAVFEMKGTCDAVNRASGFEPISCCDYDQTKQNSTFHNMVNQPASFPSEKSDEQGRGAALDFSRI
jgi:hypothetical protein